jgi:class III cytochrome C family protein/cytochrome c7-like protein
MRLRSAIFVLFATPLIAFVLQRTSAQEPARQEPAAQNNSKSAAKSEPPVQPIPYSHKKHLAFGLKCQQCHPNPEPGDRMTLPAAKKCMTCHATVAKEKPAIQKLAEFAKSDQPIPWTRVYVVAGWVYWNHRSHLEAGMTCEQCHGQVDQMEVMAKAVDATSMAGCIACHRKNDVSTGCRFCHTDK